MNPPLTTSLFVSRDRVIQIFCREKDNILSWGNSTDTIFAAERNEPARVIDVCGHTQIA